MKVGIIGSGQVGQVLATAFLKEGHSAMLGTRDTAKETVQQWKANNGSGLIGSFAEAAAFGDIIVLAIQGAVAQEALQLAGLENFSGKTVIDATNPIAKVAPVNGVLSFFTTPNDSLMERLQQQLPAAHFVKAFNSVGSGFMYQPDFGGTRPTMFICGNHTGAKQTVTGILDAFGWETADMGGAEAARAIEPLCMLWCIPGFLHNQWAHAFKLLKK
jgi:8-hydroxy-5-deazaflavin:NADPH oxidoreductase